MISVPRRALALCVALLVGVLLSQAIPSVAAADYVRDASWHLRALNIAAAQQISVGSGVTVAVVDSGVDSQQPELSGSVLPGVDAVHGFVEGNPADLIGHGTGIASLIAGHGFGPAGGSGVLGIAPGSRILPVRASLSGRDDSSDVFAEGIVWAVDHGAKVICVAHVGGDSPEWVPALARAAAADVVVIVAVGNRPENGAVGYPALVPGTVPISATDSTGTIATVSLTGPQTLLAAPGVAIPVPKHGGGYGTVDGTSASAAIVAGVAALVRAKYPNLSAHDVVHRLEVTADDKGTAGRDDQYGYGIVNPVKALTADVPTLSPRPPTPTATQPPGTHGSGPGNGTGDSGTTVVIVGILVVLFLAAGGVALVARRHR